MKICCISEDVAVPAMYTVIDLRVDLGELFGLLVYALWSIQFLFRYKRTSIRAKENICGNLTILV